MNERYFLRAQWQEQWQEVTREQWIRAERMAGFRPKYGGDGPATGGFSGYGVSGKIEYADSAAPTGEAKPDAPQT